MTIVAAEMRHADLSLPGTFTDVSYQLPEDLTFAEWEQIGEVLRYLGKSVMWWIGDWVRYGERKYGEMYAQAIEVTGYDYQTLADAVYVAKHVDFSRRHENLSWSHHKEIASRDPSEQAALLDRVEQEGWTREQLRRELRQRRLGAPSPTNEDPLDHPDDLAGLDEYGTPLVWNDNQTAEHLNPVRVLVRFDFNVPNPQTRTRGDKRDEPREAVESEAKRKPISLTFPVSVREAGWQGLSEVADALRKAVLTDPVIRQDWQRIPSTGHE